MDEPLPLVREFALAESINNVEQETAGYARTVGEGESLRSVSGAGLADVRNRAVNAFGRVRTRAV